MSDAPQDDMFGTEPHKLVRTEDPGTSHAAARSVDTGRWEQRVLETIQSFPNGCIQDDVLNSLTRRFGQLPYSTVTARFKALETKGLITYTGEKRKGNSGRPSRVRRAV